MVIFNTGNQYNITNPTGYMQNKNNNNENNNNNVNLQQMNQSSFYVAIHFTENVNANSLN